MEREVKRTWVAPELVTVARSRPQEAILAICKAAGLGGGAQEYQQGCYEGLEVGCSGCLNLADS